MNDFFHTYLERIYQDVMFKDIVGKHAMVGSLHYNRLLSFRSFKEAMLQNLTAEQKTISKELAERFPDTSTPHINQGDHLDLLVKKHWNDDELSPNNIRLIQLMIELRNEALLLSKDAYNNPLIPHENLMQDLSEQKGTFNIIYGPPGYGKTIHLRQFAERFVYHQRANNGSILPLFFQAANLQDGLENRTSDYRLELGEIDDDDLGKVVSYKNQAEYTMILAHAVEESVVGLDQEFIDNLRELMKGVGTTDSLQGKLLIVDALDEVQPKSFDDVIHFLYRSAIEKGTNVVFTIRNTHGKLLNDTLDKLSKYFQHQTNSDHNDLTVNEYHIDFTLDELRYDMPNKLTTAWGINGSIQRIMIQELFPLYKQVLTHPIFVGMFSKLIIDGALRHDEQLDNITEQNLTVGGYSFQHAAFYQEVIAKAVEFALTERRDPQITENRIMTSNRALEIFNTLSHIVFLNDGERSIETILNRLQNFDDTIDDTELEWIKNNVGEFGILYATNGTHIEWVHKTLYEAGHATFCHIGEGRESDSVVKNAMSFMTYIYLEHRKLGNSRFTDTLAHLILYSEHREIRDECINQYPRSTDQFLEGIQTGESGAITATISKGLDAQTEEFAKICKTLIETGNADLLKPQFFKVKTDYEKAVEISRIQSSNSSDRGFTAENLKLALKENEWEEYVPVYAKHAEEVVAINEIDRLLGKDGSANIVEITGVGGLGKTTAAREYMKRCIEGDFRSDEPYSYYFYYTAKGEQGEIETTFGKKKFATRAADWKSGGGGNYLEALGFNLFLSKICSSLNLHANQHDSLEEALVDYLKGNQILIVLDNFEDVTPKNAELYRKFFKKMNTRDNRARVIITSRQKGQFPNLASQVVLDNLDGIQATELMLKRYRYLTQRRSSEGYIYSEPVMKFIQEFVKNKESLPDKIIQQLKPKLEPDVIQHIGANLKHPIMILRLTSILNSELIKTSASDNLNNVEPLTSSRIMNIILSIIADNENEFTNWFKDVIEWIMKKAYISLGNDPAAIKILELLYQEDSKMLSRQQIFSRLFLLEEFHETLTIATMERSIEAIERHVIFIEDITSDDHESKLKLTDRSTTLLPEIFDSVVVQSDQAADEMDYIKLLNSVGKRNFTWDDFSEIVNGFLFVKTSPEYEKLLASNDTLSTVEETLIERVLNGQRQYITTQFKSIVRLLAHASDTQGSIQFANKYLNLFIENFNMIAEEELASLCGGWFGDHNSFPFFEVEQYEVLARLFSKILSRGVQLHAKTIRDAYHGALLRCDGEKLRMSLSDRSENSEFVSLMKRFANMLDWSMPLQNLYDELDVDLGDYDRFKTSVTQSYRNSVVVIHPDSKTKELKGVYQSHVVYGDKENNYVQLFVSRKVEHTESASKPLPEAFSQWLSLPAVGHPGLSSDPHTLAADMLAVQIFHNQVFIKDDRNKKQDRFNSAQRMKKLFSRYHTNEITAVSLAFIIGYRSPLTHLKPEEIKKRLVEEVKRRLHIFDQPNLYFEKGQITELIGIFERLCTNAVELLDSDRDEITAKMISRKIKTLDVSMSPYSLETEAALREVSLDDLNVVPKKFEIALRNLASKPMFSRNKFMEDLIKLTGGTENYVSQMKAYEHTSWTQRKHLDISWIDVVVKAVFQRPANEKYVRYEKEDVQELLNEVLALHGAVSS